MKSVTFYKSVSHAWRGITTTAKTERNFRLQLFAASVALIFSVVFPLTVPERIVLLLLSGAVLVLEIINSALERIADAVAPRLSFMVKEVKDMMAGAVLITAVLALLVGFMIFWPHFRVLMWYTTPL